MLCGLYVLFFLFKKGPVKRYLSHENVNLTKSCKVHIFYIVPQPTAYPRQIGVKCVEM